MENQMKPLCVLIGDVEYCKLIQTILFEDYSTLILENTDNLLSTLQTTNVYFFVAYIKNFEKYRKYFNQIKNLFPQIPSIAIIHETDNLEIARICGEMGFNKVTSYNAIYSLKSDIQNMIEKESIQVKLTDFGINIGQYPKTIQSALLIIEKHYIQLIGVNEIALSLNVSECYLPKEFKINELPPPKKLLLYFKIRHSILLMKNAGLNINEISMLSGFTCTQRYIECFKRMFGKPPGGCRNEITEGSDMEFWNKNLGF